MRIVKAKPSTHQIEALLKNCYETLYLEGIDGLSRKEISRYHSKIFDKNYKDDNFIIVSDDNSADIGMAIFRHLEWDTRYLGQSIARIDLVITRKNISNRKSVYNLLIEEIFSTCREKGIDLIFFRNSINNDLLNHSLASIGAYPISVLVNLYYSFAGRKKGEVLSEGPRILVRRPKRTEFRQLEEIMTNEFENRLLCEPLFRKKDVKDLYRGWIRNDLKGRVREVLVAITNGRICGFVALDQMIINRKKYGFIDMLIVKKSFRRKGIGTSLMNEAMVRLYKDSEGVFLGAELEKPEAVNFYINLGFRIVSSSYTYHIYPGKI